jgi:hypothetical protein
VCVVPKRRAPAGTRRHRRPSAAAPRQSVSFDQETNAWLEEMAAAQDRSVSATVRYCVRFARRAYETDKAATIFPAAPRRTT